jgi:hypothetical protein
MFEDPTRSSPANSMRSLLARRANTKWPPEGSGHSRSSRSIAILDEQPAKNSRAKWHKTSQNPATLCHFLAHPEGTLKSHNSEQGFGLRSCDQRPKSRGIGRALVPRRTEHGLATAETADNRANEATASTCKNETNEPNGRGFRARATQYGSCPSPSRPCRRPRSTLIPRRRSDRRDGWRQKRSVQKSEERARTAQPAAASLRYARRG